MSAIARPHIAEIRLTCPDVELTTAFYEAAFGAAPVGNDRIMVGQQTVALFPTSVRASRAAPGNATSFQHFAIVVSDMDRAIAHLQTVPGWKPISMNGPVRLPAESGGVSAFKFRDPDGHPLELLSFPGDTLPAAWRDAGGLFLGIDHTALSVENTARSVDFYRGLGFSIAAQTLNEGPEQARLDGLDEPRVAVTALQLGAVPPHLELLCYERPQARPDPRPADDVMATVIALANIDATKQAALDPDSHRLAFV